MNFKSLRGLIVALVCCLATPGLANEECGLRTQIDMPGLPNGRQTVTYCKVEGQDRLDGDIILPPQRVEAAADGGHDYAGVVSRKSSLWPRGRVAYRIHPGLSQPRRVTEAIAHWHSRTSVRFVARTTEKDYITFTPGGGCSSSIGRVGGEQTVVLATGCDTGSVIHELGHALGLWHEQSRNDRDQFIQILWQNIGEGHKFNFNKFEGGGTNHGRYDYASIMHYEPYAFSKNGAPTIVPRGGAQIPKWARNHLSDGDVAAIEYLYR
jgi:hypothetical protein